VRVCVSHMQVRGRDWPSPKEKVCVSYAGLLAVSCHHCIVFVAIFAQIIVFYLPPWQLHFCMTILPLAGSNGFPCNEGTSCAVGCEAPAICWSDANVQAIVNRGSKRPTQSAEDLPTSSYISIGQLVELQANRSLACYGSKEHRVRLRRKTPMSRRELLEQIASQPDRAACPGDKNGWKDRETAAKWFAQLYAQTSGLTVRYSRYALAESWKKATSEEKTNAVWLMHNTQLGSLETKQHKVKPKEIRCIGCGLTWQTQWGRGADDISQWFHQDFSLTDLEELCRTSLALKNEFGEFMTMVSRQVVAIGMALYTCSCELNSKNADVARVHYHAYVCQSWQNWRTEAGMSPAIIRVTDWSFKGAIPHPNPAQVRNSQNPAKVLQGGLWYQAHRKEGLLFHGGNQSLWKDSSQIMQKPSCKVLRRAVLLGVGFVSA